ncbi:MAG: hypothetical protein GXC76_14180 [Rhodanobacteraceae bacterium]|nr:hypothetical protein [Rhodanobacteraceae bacterium]
MNHEIHVRYAEVIESINESIRSFNSLLNESMQFRVISPGDPLTYSDSMKNGWGAQGWPSKDSPGIYALCCAEMQNKSNVAVYIGKASMRVMGHRMYSHLNPFRDKGVYLRKHGGKDFEIEAMLASPVQTAGAGCLASALEEYVIARGVSGALLLNSTGVRQ